MDDVLVLFYFHCYAPHPVRRSVDTRMDPSISGGTLSRGQETLQELKPEKIMMNYVFKRDITVHSPQQLSLY